MTKYELSLLKPLEIIFLTLIFDVPRLPLEDAFFMEENKMTADVRAGFTPHTEVYVWLAKDAEGVTTTSTASQSIRCGHVAMEIFPNADASVYISLWPREVVPDPHGLVTSRDNDERYECSKPDVIMRLHHLNIPAMIQAFNQMGPRIRNREITWKIDTSDSENLTSPGTQQASCASFVYFLLKIGGLADLASPYFKHQSGRGPKDASFYHITKCDAGDRWGGVFNGAPWTGWKFTPKAALLRIASAAEAFPLDKETTIAIMASDRVAKRKIQEKDWGGTVGAVAVVGLAVLIMHNSGKK